MSDDDVKAWLRMGYAVVQWCEYGPDGKGTLHCAAIEPGQLPALKAAIEPFGNCLYGPPPEAAG